MSGVAGYAATKQMQIPRRDAPRNDKSTDGQAPRPGTWSITTSNNFVDICAKQSQYLVPSGVRTQLMGNSAGPQAFKFETEVAPNGDEKES